jgi:hypothetical protein
MTPLPMKALFPPDSVHQGIPLYVLLSLFTRWKLLA